MADKLDVTSEIAAIRTTGGEGVDEGRAKRLLEDYESGGYPTPDALQPINVDEAIRKISETKTKTPSERKSKWLKILLLRYIRKYRSNPRKFIVHPKQIRNLPSWFEDAIAAFPPQEMSDATKKDVRDFFQNLIAWRDEQVGTPDLDEMKQQYGLAPSPYNPAGITEEDAEGIVSGKGLQAIDMEGMQRGLTPTSSEDDLFDEDVTAPSPVPMAGADIEESAFITPIKGISIEEPDEEEVAPVQAPMQVPGPALTMPAGVAPTYTRPPTQYKDEKSLSRMIVGGSGTIRTPSMGGAGDLAKRLSGMISGRFTTTGRIENVGTSPVSVRRTSAQMKARPKSMKVKKVKSIYNVTAANVTFGKRKPIVKTGKQMRNPVAKVRVGKLPTVRDIKPSASVKVGGKTIELLTHSVNSAVNPLKVKGSMGYVNGAIDGVKKMMPKSQKVITKKSGEHIIKEAAMLDGMVGSGGSMRSEFPKIDFKIPDLSPPEYNFGVLKRRKKNPVIEPSDVDMEDYVERYE